MGARTKITTEQINNLIKDTNIVLTKIDKTIDGISDSTYIGYDSNQTKYIFKIYEFASVNEVVNEINILNTFNNLPTPKAITNKDNIQIFENKPVALFTFLEGQSSINITLDQVNEIGLFLGKLHSFTQNIKSVNKNIYSQKEIKMFIDAIQNANDISSNIKNKFQLKYEKIKDLDLSENCVIHGDLFPDNTKFLNGKLTGVFDFIEACNGNFFFDLSVVINSWCFNDNYNLKDAYFNAILLAYNEYAPVKINERDIKHYMLYASLFYACQRFNTKFIEKRDVQIKDYNEYLVKFDNILG